MDFYVIMENAFLHLIFVILLRTALTDPMKGIAFIPSVKMKNFNVKIKNVYPRKELAIL